MRSARQILRIAFLGSDAFSSVIAERVHSVNALKLIVTPTAARVSREKSNRDEFWSGCEYPNDTVYKRGKFGTLREIQPDLILSASFGAMIPTSIINLVPPLHAINIHPSLLPQYRGAAPIQWAIANGDKYTGLSIQELSKGAFDRGKLLMKARVEIPKDANYSELARLLADKAADMTELLIGDFEKYKSQASEQQGDASFARKIQNAHSKIDWSNSDAAKLMRWHRATSHQVPLWTTYQGKRVQFKEIAQRSDSTTFKVNDSYADTLSLSPGQAVFNHAQQAVEVQCSNGLLAVSAFKTAGRPLLNARDWWNGAARGHDSLVFE